MSEECCSLCGSKLAGSPLDKKRKRLLELADGTRTAKQIGLELGFSTTRVVHYIDRLRRRGHVINIPKGAGSTPGFNAYTPEQRAEHRREWHRRIDEASRLARERQRDEELRMQDALSSIKEEVLPLDDVVKCVVELTGLDSFDVEMFIAGKIRRGEMSAI